MKKRFVCERPRYQDLLMHYRKTEAIKVLRGVRRCGKSTLLKLFIEDLEKRGVRKGNIFFRRFDEFSLPLKATAEDLVIDIAKARENSDTADTFYVFLDEVQEVDGWERVVRGLHTQANTDVYLTGSNAFLLSSDLATLLAGRFVAIDIYPLSFAEYLSFSERAGRPAKSRDAAFGAYLRFGGMPSLFSLQSTDEEDVTRELSSIYDTVILNDVARRFAIRDFALLEKLVHYVFSTSGGLFSVRSIVNTLASVGRKTAYETVESYLGALEGALVLHGVPQIGLRGKRILRPLKKYYPVDTGLRNLAAGFSADNFGFQLENAVFGELLRRGYRLEIGVAENGEVDFVGTRRGEKLYVQVTETMVDPAVFAREVGALEQIADSFPKLVLTLDRLHAGLTGKGVRIGNVIDWMAEGSPS